MGIENVAMNNFCLEDEVFESFEKITERKGIVYFKKNNILYASSLFVEDGKWKRGEPMKADAPFEKGQGLSDIKPKSEKPTYKPAPFEKGQGLRGLLDDVKNLSNMAEVLESEFDGSYKDLNERLNKVEIENKKLLEDLEKLKLENRELKKVYENIKDIVDKLSQKYINLIEKYTKDYKVTSEQIEQAKTMLKNGMKERLICERVGISKGTLWRIKKNKIS